MKTFGLFIIFILAVVLVESNTYEGFKVYHVLPENEKSTEFLRKFSLDNNYDIWTGNFAAGSVTDVMVPPNAQKSFENHLINNEIKFSTMVDNVARIIDEEKYETSKLESYISSRNINFDNYFRLNDIYAYLQDLSKKYPKLVTLETIGRSTQGRDLVVVKISSGGSGNKPVVFIDGTIHAREWISTAVVLYIINQLVENNNNSNLYSNVDWYIFPVINVDGYEYTHTTFRLWRKTLSVGVKCNGTDANRNFDHHWGEVDASDDECSNMYRGKKPFSEPEILALSNFIKKYSKTIKLYLNVHSYGQYLLYPWGYTNKTVANQKELQSLGEAANKAIKAVNGTVYTTGKWWEVLYPSSGISIDWAYELANITLPYTVELPGYEYGFVLPPKFIKPICNETFEGIKVFGKYIDKKYGQNV